MQGNKKNRGKLDFGNIQKAPAQDKAMLTSLYDMFGSAERFEEKQPEILEQVKGARARSTKNATSSLTVSVLRAVYG